MQIRMLTVEDVEIYQSHCEAHRAESGRDGEIHHGPYPRDEPLPTDFVERTRARWSKALDEPGWRRAWGVFDGERLVGTGDVTGSDLASGRHRVNLGMGLQRSHRGRGGGRALLGHIIAWCRAEPTVAWLDLGVFGGNDRAHELYRRAGFTELGCIADRFRVDGLSIDDTLMTLDVSGP